MAFKRSLRLLNILMLLILTSSHGAPVDTDSADVDLSRPHPNVFIDESLSAIQKPNDLVFFNGHSVKRELGKGLTIHGHMNIKTWQNVVDMVNTKGNSGMKNYTENHAIHMHNEFMPGDFLELMQRSMKQKGKWKHGTLFTRKHVQDAMAMSEPQLLKPLVITNSVDENWGFLSTPIGTRTAKWINLTNHLRIHNSNYDTMRAVLDSDKVTVMTVNAHWDPDFGIHKKVISLPLGVRHRDQVFKAMHKYRFTNKTKLFTINNSGWKERTLINKQLIARFAKYNYTLMNTFPGKTPKKQLDARPKAEIFESHYQEVAASKFALCPSGLSMDSYRLWETLALGSIPVVESNPGFDRTYANLPVLVVHNYSVVTPMLLEQVYPCFYANAERFKYTHLTSIYWHKLIHRAIKQGTHTHLVRMHPFRNAYCDVLSPSGKATTGLVASKRPDGRSAQPHLGRRRRHRR